MQTILGLIAVVIGVYSLSRTTREDATPAPQPPAPQAIETTTSAVSPATSAPATPQAAYAPGDATVPKLVAPAAATTPAPSADVPLLIAFARDGRLVVACAAGRVESRDVVSGLRQVLNLRCPAPRSLDVAPDGGAVAIAHAGGTSVWHTTSASETKLPAAGVTVIRFARALTLATGHADGAVQLWDATTWARVSRLHPNVGRVRAARFAPDGRLIVMAGKGAVVWDFTARQIKTRLSPEDAVASIAFSPDGRLLAVADEHGTSLWETSLWQKQATIDAGRVPMHVEFWRSGTTLVIATADGTIALWDLATRQRMVQMSGGGSITSIALNADDRTIATCGSGGILLWDATTRAARKLE